MIPDSQNSDKINTWSYLTLLLPVAFVLVASFESWRFLVGIGSCLGIGWTFRLYRLNRLARADKLNSIFYQLIQENQGKITVLDLAMKAQISGNIAQDFLEKRAQEFAADFEIKDGGGILYQFSTAYEEEVNLPLVLSPLTQTDLAKRLAVHPNTISKRKTRPDFRLWSYQKDPDSIGWEYSPETKRFYPIKD